MDVVPLEIEEEVAVVAEKKIVVRLPVAVAESVVGVVVAEEVEAEKGVGSREENWTLVKRRVRESGEERRKRLLEEEREAVRKRMNVWHRAKVEVPNAPLGPRSMRVRFGTDSGYGSPSQSGLGKGVVVSEGVERKSCSSVKDSLATVMVLQKSVEKSRALESENSKLQLHVKVLCRRIHEVIVQRKVWSKILSAFD
ncbi:hypothetical protein HOY80DRAFT_1064743 [Tuber brumale]|nr:hypothetical protein HOY80DRAFT_1064743 [Tuber brumale]